MKDFRSKVLLHGSLAWVVLAVWVLHPSSSTQTRTLSFSTVDDVDTVSFDPAKISEPNLRKLILLSPFVVDYINDMPNKNFSAAGSIVGAIPDKGLIALPLELCLAGDPAYSNCKQNDPAGPDFLHNARVNLRKSKEGLAWLEQLAHPRELDQVINFLREGLSHSIWVEETRLKYYSTWDDSGLKETHEGVDPERLCPGVFVKLQTAASKNEKYTIARFDWSNCLAKSASKNQGKYPIEAWKHFLDAYGITENYKQKGPD